MNKQEYINICEKDMQEPAKSKMIEQINLFYDLIGKNLENETYNVGEDVILKKDTFLHGFGNSKLLLDKYASEGLISKDFECEVTDKKISYCVSLWHIHKKIKLADYVKTYSGMTFSWGKDKFKIVPFGELDKFVESLRYQDYFSLKAESTMESRFLPCLQKDGRLTKKSTIDRFSGCRQLAFILNGRDKECRQLAANNLLEDSIPLETVMQFFRMRTQERIDQFKANRRAGEDERIAYILFGLPANMIEGVFVGRIYENDKKMLKHIKEILPNCYICNLDGKVIVGNK